MKLKNQIVVLCRRSTLTASCILGEKYCLPSTTKVRITIRKRRTILPKITVQWRCETLESHAKHPMQTFKNRNW